MTSPLRYPWATPPTLGQGIAIAPGLGWVRMPLPFTLDHINLWLLRDENGAVLVDTGFGDAPTREAWRALLAGQTLCRVLVTHYHPDHMGNAGWFESAFGARLLTSEREFLWSQTMCYLPDKIELERRLDFYRSHGMEPEQIDGMAQRRNWYPQGVPTVAGSFERLSEGQVLSLGGTDWRVILTYGHAPEHVCLFSEQRGVLISGDQILPRISPNVGVWFPEPESDPLRLFLESLQRLRELPEDCLVLPSHGLPFYGLRSRIDALLQHHADRLSEIVSACRIEALSAAEVTRILFQRPLDLHQMSFAMAEAVAHLNRLVEQGQAIVEKRGRSIRFRCL